MSAASNVQAEVDALDRILTRLALTDESQLEALLSKLLPMVIERLSHPEEPIRKKCMEILAHCNQRCGRRVLSL